MRFKYDGNKPDLIALVIQNQDPNNTVIKAGAPVFFNIPPTVSGNRGLEVAAADGLANAAHAFFAGFNIGQAVQIGQFSEAMAFGYYDFARVLLSTRATTTDVWASYAAIAIGDIYSFVSSSGVQAIQRSGAGSATNLGWWMVAAQTLASATTQASSFATSGVGNSTALITQLRVQVRAI